MRSPGFLTELQKQLESLDISHLESVNREGGLEVSELLGLLTKPIDHSVYDPVPADVSSYTKISDTANEAFWSGRESLASGDTLYVLITSPDCFQEHQGHASQIETHLIRASWVKKIALLVDPINKRKALEVISSLGRDNIKILDSFVTFLLTPDNRLDSLHDICHLTSCGQGDLINALRGEVTDFKYVYAANACDDRDINPTIVGQHLHSDRLVTSELIVKSKVDPRPVFCNHAGFPQLVEPYRFSHELDRDSFNLIGSEHYVFSARLLEDEIDWKWHRRKVIEDGRIVVKFERTLCNLTSHYQTQFILAGS